MDPKVRKSIVAVAFVGAVIYGIMNFTGNSGTAPAAGPRPISPAKAAAAPQAAKFIDIEKYSLLDWGTDPFRHGENAGQMTQPSNPVSPAWTLGGILFDESHPAAIINGQVVRRGGTINGALVKKIGKTEVTLEKDGAEISLSIAKDKS